MTKKPLAFFNPLKNADKGKPRPLLMSRFKGYNTETLALFGSAGSQPSESLLLSVMWHEIAGVFLLRAGRRIVNLSTLLCTGGTPLVSLVEVCSYQRNLLTLN